jgi:hypothetical protein
MNIFHDPWAALFFSGFLAYLPRGADDVRALRRGVSAIHAADWPAVAEAKTQEE